MDVREYIRQHKDIDRKDLAERLGVSPSSFRSWLSHGGSTYGEDLLKRIVAVVTEQQLEFFEEIRQRKKVLKKLTYTYRKQPRGEKMSKRRAEAWERRQDRIQAKKKLDNLV